MTPLQKFGAFGGAGALGALVLFTLNQAPPPRSSAEWATWFQAGAAFLAMLVTTASVIWSVADSANLRAHREAREEQDRSERRLVELRRLRETHEAADSLSFTLVASMMARINTWENPAHFQLAKATGGQSAVDSLVRDGARFENFPIHLLGDSKAIVLAGQVHGYFQSFLDCARISFLPTMRAQDIETIVGMMHQTSPASPTDTALSIT